MARRTGTAGFSLVEVMVVVAIVGIVSALAGPNIAAAIRRANEPAQLQRVHGFISEARNYARRTNQCVVVTRGAGGATLTATPLALCPQTASCRCRQSVVAPETTTLQLTTSPPAVRVTRLIGNTGVEADVVTAATGDNLLFFADGSTPYAGIAQVEVGLPERGPRLLNILPASGIVRVVP